MPETRSASRWPQMGRVDRDDGLETRGTVIKYMDRFMRVKVWQIPNSGHLVTPKCGRIHFNSVGIKLRTGVIILRNAKVTRIMRGE